MKSKFFPSILLVITSLFVTSCEQAGGGQEQPKRPTEGIEKFTIYAINDFHGAIKEEGTQMGLGYLGSYMLEKTKNEKNNLFIDSGDSWQGSLESNYNEGKVINDVYNYANISARVVGNHDFDWGLNTLGRIIKDECSYPTLSANIYGYDWSKKEVGLRQEQYGKQYVIYTLPNAVKVGIIGTIGEEQITSISSQLVDTITFTEQNREIQSISDYLRTEEKCDVIIAASHSSYDQIDSEALTKISNVSKKRYVDLVLNAHTHQEETFTKNNVKFAQFGGYGELIGKIDMYYDFKKNEVVDLSTNVSSISAASVKRELNYKINSGIQSIIDTYDAETKNLGSQVLSTNFSGSFFSSEQLPNLMAEAIYNESINEGFTVDFAYTNYARASHYNSTMTYSDLYNIFPFDNSVPIIEVTGKQAANMLRFQNFIYRADPNLSIRYEGVYKVACLDYLAFHCDENRDYNYFPGATVLGYLRKNNQNYCYREILKNYLLANPEKTFAASDYSCSNPTFAREQSYLY